MTGAGARTAGVDLAAADARTALAVIAWSDDGARLDLLQLGVSDADIVATASGVDRIGIDCAFGWPDAFVAFVGDVQRGDFQPPSEPDGEWRRGLAYRETDRRVHTRVGRWPLSVSTDRLGVTAMRCAVLLSRLAAQQHVIDRSGMNGLVAEVYPGATLRAWGFDTTAYRTDAAARRSLLAQLERQAPWLDLAGFQDKMVRESDSFDAVVAALASRLAHLGLNDGPEPEVQEAARREGWVVLPRGPLGDLGPSGDARA